MSRRILADPAALSATEAAEAVRERRLTSEALVRACLDRIAEREPQVQAWAHLDPEYALAQAKARDAELHSGRGIGPLHGVPIGVKDIFDTIDFATRKRLSHLRRPAPRKGCGLHRAFARSGRGHPRQDGDDRARAALPSAHAQPA